MTKLFFAATLSMFIAGPSFAQGKQKTLTCQIIDVKSGTERGVEVNKANIICRMVANDANSGKLLTVYVSATNAVILNNRSTLPATNDGRFFTAKISTENGRLVLKELDTEIY